MLEDIINKFKTNILGISDKQNSSGNRNTSNPVNKLFNFQNKSRSMLNYKLIGYEQARIMIENQEIVLIDVRSKSEYDVMHIINAVNIPVSEIDKKIFEYQQTQGIMVYCTTGTRSKNAIQILNSLGYTNIYIWEYAALANFPFKDMLVYKEN